MLNKVWVQIFQSFFLYEVIIIMIITIAILAASKLAIASFWKKNEKLSKY